MVSMSTTSSPVHFSVTSFATALAASSSTPLSVSAMAFSTATTIFSPSNSTTFLFRFLTFILSSFYLSTNCQHIVVKFYLFLSYL